MRTPTILLLLGLCLAGTQSAAAQSDALEPIPAHITVASHSSEVQSAHSAGAEDGAELYRQACATCHVPRGGRNGHRCVLAGLRRTDTRFF